MPPRANHHELAARLKKVWTRIRTAEIRYGRPTGSVTMVAVSKDHPAPVVVAAYALGLRHFGESYLQEALPKMAEFAAVADITWHYIGTLQSNKTLVVAHNFSWVHSLDRLKIAQRLNAQRPPNLPVLDVCIQVNVANDPHKTGVHLNAVESLATGIATLPRLRLRGLMTLPPPKQNIAQQRGYFRSLRNAQEQLRAAGYAVDSLSMGMSDDLEAAIAEGATLIRVGSALFGPRTAEGSTQM
jgi:PLP dependent protein